MIHFAGGAAVGEGAYTGKVVQEGVLEEPTFKLKAEGYKKTTTWFVGGGAYSTWREVHIRGPKAREARRNRAAQSAHCAGQTA